MRLAVFARTLLLAVLATAAFGATATGHPARADSKAAAFIDRVLQLTNDERRKQGLAPLVQSDKLASSAHWKAEDMATKNYFDHSDQNGQDFIDRAEHYGFANWTFLGENIAAGQTTPEEVVAEWMASPGHRKNILKPQFKEIGIGYAVESRSTYRVYWVQEFGTR